MATTDLERLIVSLEASFVKYEKAWSKAMGVTDTNVKRAQQKFDAMSSSISNAGADAGNALEPLRANTAGLAAQFQDIVVQLQSGQSPFLIALQQGTQLSGMLNETKNPVRALGAAFMQAVNPVSLLTIGVIGLGGAAVQYFATMLQDGQASAEELKNQEDLVRRVADRWGEAVPALRAYVDELDRAAQLEELGQATQTAITKEYEDLVATILTLRSEFAGARFDLQQLGTSAQDIDELQAAFDNLDKKAKDGTASAGDVERVLDLVAETAAGATTPSLKGLSGTLQGLVSDFGAAARAADQFRQQQAAIANAGAGRDLRERFGTQKFIEEQERVNGLTAEQLELETELGRVKSEAERDDVVVTEAQALAIAQQRLAAEERRSQIAAADRQSGRSGKSAANDAEREREAVVELISALEHELELVGMTAPQKEVANALRRAGAAATDEQRTRIEELINSIHAEEQAVDGAKKQMEEFRDISQQALSGFIRDVMAGKSATEALGNALGNIGNKLLDKGLDLIFDSIFPFAEGGVAAFGRPKTFANGGIARSASIFGEAGPEAAVPLPDGRRIPVDLRMPAMPSAAGGQIHVSASMEVVNGNLVPVITQVSGRIAGQAIKANNRQTPNLLRDAQMRMN